MPAADDAVGLLAFDAGRHRFGIPAASVEHVVRAAATALPTGTGTVLLAEDDEVLRTMTSKLLERLGYDTIVAADGREALETIIQRGARIHLAILDVVMPEIGGPAVAERVGDRWPHLRYVFTTGYSPSSVHLAHLRGSAIPVLQKPYGVTALAQTVSRALAQPLSSA